MLDDGGFAETAFRRRRVGATEDGRAVVDQKSKVECRITENGSYERK
jgi:hypothetical protein